MILILSPAYFLMIFCVSSEVLKEFMRTRGTSAPYVLFRCSICCTARSRNVRSSLMGMVDLGPLHPMLVPRPPLSLTTTSLVRRSETASGVSGEARSS